MEPLTFNEVETPRPMTGQQRQAKYAAKHPDKAQASQVRYRETYGSQRKDAHYLSKPFCAWDGEGYTNERGEHVYNLFAGKCETYTTTIENQHGLSTAEIFECLLDFADDHPDAIHVIYGGSYDFNMWCRDMDQSTVRYIYSHKFGSWNNYRISWRRGKSFYVCRIDSAGKKIGNGVTVYDIVSFFQSSFVAACDSYLGDRFLHRDMIVAQKAARGSFTADDVSDVIEYNDAELDNLIMLANELRERLNKVGLRPRRWDSCGAIAAALMEQHGIKKIVQNARTPEDVLEASRYAYAGGRFELIQFGHYDGKVYEYDVNSAYPAALRNVPDLSDGEWQHVHGDPGPQDFAIYHIDSGTDDESLPAPLFRRDGNGTVCYPHAVVGWYWSPEYNVWKEFVERGLSKGKVIEAWIFRPTNPDRKPFGFVEPLYMKRRALKKAKDGAHVGIKLGLNSLYGKLAQQVGAEQQGDGWRLPPYHCLEWAGYATSHCRAAVLHAVVDDLDSVIAFETDAVFRTRKLPVAEGSNLGEFEYIEFDNITYLQSGLYFADTADGPIAKTRGVDRGELQRDTALKAMSEPKVEDRYAVARLTRFVGAGIALMGRWRKWRSWETVTKRMTMEPTGKRIHIDCETCDPDFTKPLTMGLHRTFCPMINKAHSLPFPIMWVNPDPNMTELSEFRESENDYAE